MSSAIAAAFLQKYSAGAVGVSLGIANSCPAAMAGTDPLSSSSPSANATAPLASPLAPPMQSATATNSHTQTAVPEASLPSPLPSSPHPHLHFLPKDVQQWLAANAGGFVLSALHVRDPTKTDNGVAASATLLPSSSASAAVPTLAPAPLPLTTSIAIGCDSSAVGSLRLATMDHTATIPPPSSSPTPQPQGSEKGNSGVVGGGNSKEENKKTKTKRNNFPLDWVQCTPRSLLMLLAHPTYAHVLSWGNAAAATTAAASSRSDALLIGWDTMDDEVEETHHHGRGASTSMPFPAAADCPLFIAYRRTFDGEERAGLGAGGRDLKESPLLFVSHHVGTLQFTIERGQGLPATSLVASPSPSAPPLLLYDAYFGCVGKPSEVKALWSRGGRMAILMAQLRRQFVKLADAACRARPSPSPSSPSPPQPLRILLLCVGRVSGDTQGLVPTVNGRKLYNTPVFLSEFPSSCENLPSSSSPSSSPPSPFVLVGSMSNSDCLNDCSVLFRDAIATAQAMGRYVTGGILPEVSATSACPSPAAEGPAAGERSSNTPPSSPQPPLLLSLMEIHIAFSNVFEPKEMCDGAPSADFSMALLPSSSAPSSESSLHNKRDAYGYSIVFHNKFVGFPSSSTPWNNVGTMTSSWLKELFC